MTGISLYVGIYLQCICIPAYTYFLQLEQQEIREAALEKQESEEAAALELDDDNQAQSKSARAYAKTYKPGPPLVPSIVVDRVLKYIAKVRIRKAPEFLHLVCRYWSLKREARRGAPLLKRLHLEPWTAGPTGVGETEEEKMIKLDVSSYYAFFFEFGRGLIHFVSNYKCLKTTWNIFAL